MILLGAGSSVPFEIPGMLGFTENFKEHIESKDNDDFNNLLSKIEESISKSEEILDISLSFDLEMLLSILTDLSGAIGGKPITIPTSSFLIYHHFDHIGNARKEYGSNSLSLLNLLRDFIFKICIDPIEKGKNEGNFHFLDHFYGPLMTILNQADLSNIQPIIGNIFSTNWDLCFKTWSDYMNITINDGTAIDNQSYPFLNLEKFAEIHEKRGIGFNYVPLHGSHDFIHIERPKGSGTYQDIQKISDSIGYFQNNPDNIKNIFMIYPLEAVGIEESIKSPYLDMVYSFKRTLEREEDVIVIGYSMRDPTIGSIFEEVIAKRIRQGHIKPLSSDIYQRRTEAHEHKLNIIVINRNPKKLFENMEKLGYINLSKTFIPIEVEFPKITDLEFNKKYREELIKMIAGLLEIKYINPDNFNAVQGALRDRYKIEV